MAKKTFNISPFNKASDGAAKPAKIAAIVGHPHSNIRLETGVDLKGKSYKRMMFDPGAAGVRSGKTRPKKGKV